MKAEFVVMPETLFGAHFSPVEVEVAGVDLAQAPVNVEAVVAGVAEGFYEIEVIVVGVAGDDFQHELDEPGALTAPLHGLLFYYFLYDAGDGQEITGFIDFGRFVRSEFNGFSFHWE